MISFRAVLLQNGSSWIGLPILTIRFTWDIHLVRPFGVSDPPRILIWDMDVRTELPPPSFIWDIHSEYSVGIIIRSTDIHPRHSSSVSICDIRSIWIVHLSVGCPKWTPTPNIKSTCSICNLYSTPILEARKGEPLASDIYTKRRTTDFGWVPWPLFIFRIQNDLSIYDDPEMGICTPRECTMVLGLGYLSTQSNDDIDGWVDNIDGCVNHADECCPREGRATLSQSRMR